MTRQTIPMSRDDAPEMKAVPAVVCSQGRHVCKHRGSKPDPEGRKAKNRAANKLAKHSRRFNRKAG